MFDSASERLCNLVHLVFRQMGNRNGSLICSENCKEKEIILSAKAIFIQNRKI